MTIRRFYILQENKMSKNNPEKIRRINGGAPSHPKDNIIVRVDPHDKQI